MSEARAAPDLRDLIDQAKRLIDLYELWRLLGVAGDPRQNPRPSPFAGGTKDKEFSIFANGQKWKNFGNGTGGDAIDFLMEWFQIDAAEARKRFLALAGLEGAKWTPENEEAARARQIEREQAEKEQAEREYFAFAASSLMPMILEKYAWDQYDVWEASEYRFEGQPVREMQNTFLSALFQPEACVWLGSKFDSGQGKDTDSPERREWKRNKNAQHFRPISTWLVADELPGPLICPHVFASGAIHRRAEFTVASPFLVTDIDAVFRFQCTTGIAKGCECGKCSPRTKAEKTANINAGLAVIRYLSEAIGLTLRAIVHSGNKSVHGWFTMPPPDEVEDLKAISPAMGIDVSLFHAPQVCRMPGFLHEKGQAFAYPLLLNY